MSRSDLAHHFFTMACNNAWANQRLFHAVGKLSHEEFVAPRVSFFPSFRATLNHNLTVDWLYVDALDRAFAGQPAHPDPGSFFDPAEPFETAGELASAQRAIDARLVEIADALDPAKLSVDVSIKRKSGVKVESASRLLSHLFQHQIHHRGQAHAMLAGTSIVPPQLDEFFCANEAHLREGELADLGLSEASIWGARR